MNLLLNSNINPKSLLGTFTVTAFLMTIISLVLGHIFVLCLPATVLTMLFFGMNLLFYRLNRIDEFGVNLKTGSIEAKDDEKESNDKT